MGARSRPVVMSFDGEYAFLSNFYHSPINVDFRGITVKVDTVEHAFQAVKTTDFDEFLAICDAPTPGQAKRLGRKCQLRKDWEEVKEDVMELYVSRKFQNPELRDKLLATGDANLIEGNTWHDSTWGVCMCPRCVNNPNIKGQNKLGKILMKVRDAIREEGQYWEKIL